MSQVIFKSKIADKNVEVMGGWDPPMNYYHFTIFNLDLKPDDDEEIIWACIDNFRLSELPKSTEPYIKILEEFNIEPPEDFWELCNKKEGNVVYIFNGTNWNRKDLTRR